jgi:hypothetical protein
MRAGKRGKSSFQASSVFLESEEGEGEADSYQGQQRLKVVVSSQCQQRLGVDR